MQTESELNLLSKVADAELGVAEELAWPLAILAGLVTHFYWENWLLSASISISAYVLAVYRYRRRSAAAEDRYFRAAGLGKYASRGSAADS